jgi:hypothetical protein
MLVIVWNPRGFHLISVPGQGRKFNAMHSVTEIISPLPEERAYNATESNSKLILHADNGRTHRKTLS